ncbi:WD40-repeat-containing domain protein [Gaertneriomyces semiglobifer]|nr:WD40-repeat-containing domain protein [Gaertneriomyces semiglobifer]
MAALTPSRGLFSSSTSLNTPYTPSLAGSSLALNDAGYFALGGSRDRLAAAVARKKKFGSLGSLTAPGTRDLNVVGQLRFRCSIRQDSEVFCLKFSPTNNVLAVGLGDGTIQIISTQTADYPLLRVLPSPENLPCTTLCFRANGENFKTQNVLVAGYASGQIIHWHYTSGQKLHTIDENSEPDVESDTSAGTTPTGPRTVNTVTYRHDGLMFVSGGSDLCVRLYDGQTHQRLQKLSATPIGQPPLLAGHSSRIFAAKFHPTMQNLFITSGWDNTIQIWDTRQRTSVRCIYGPHICGESIDFSKLGDTIVSGSYRKADVLQVWDFASGALVETLPWSIADEKRVTSLYSTYYSPSSKYIVAGGGGLNNEVRMFSPTLKRPVAMVQSLPGCVYTTVMNAAEDTLVIGGGDKALHVCEVDVNGLTDFVY